MKNFLLATLVAALLASASIAQSAQLASWGKLSITGGASSERIVVSTVATSPAVRVRISSISSGYVYLDQSFPAAAVQQLFIDAGSGNDDVRNDTSFESLIFGRGGNDTIYGGSGFDLIFGDGGNDTIFGREDDDWILGGSGADTLHGGAGHDDLEGEDGNDRLYGGDGNDTLAGGDGADVLHGDAGSDILIGGDAKWSPDGDPDTMIGHGGSDWFAFELIDARVGDHGTPGFESVSTKWWKGLEPWVYDAWDSNPQGSVKYWQCGG